MNYTINTTGYLLDHGEKFREERFIDLFASTSKTYQERFGELYSECACWFCEAMRESHSSGVSKWFKGKGKSGEQINEQFLYDAPQHPAKRIHMSAHNVIQPGSKDPQYAALAGVKKRDLEQYYQKACKRAAKQGRTPPERNDYYESKALGYPVRVPALSPYEGYSRYTPAYYAVSPGAVGRRPAAREEYIGSGVTGKMNSSGLFPEAEEAMRDARGGGSSGAGMAVNNFAGFAGAVGGC